MGIFGGTFDPPHLGHLVLAETCADALALAHVLWTPAADPPHKRDLAITLAAQRVAMVEAAIAGNPRFALSRVDLERPGPHYSVDMVRIVAAQYPPGTPLYFLIGGDSLRDLPTWHEPARLLECCWLAVMRRPGDNVDTGALEDQLPGLAARLRVIDAPLIEISGSEIRRRVRDGQSIRYRVPDRVAAYIAREGLYK
ncbi:MAG: nicotinate-nucleotide adenylyltransferase [Anaerolineae bacterium]|nr:nicotinate-nucleotide adenylyltransferase [Anaerolineae bacterium]